MASIESDTYTLHNGCNYYLMCKINDNDWDCIIDKAFVLHTYDSRLYGQFLSSMWFKKHINIDDVIDLLIIRLPRQNITVHSYEHITIDILRHRLCVFEGYIHLNGVINYDILDFVVIHKHYSCDTTKNTCNILKDHLTRDEYRSVITDNVISGVPNHTNINLTFEVVCTENKHHNTSQDIYKRPHLKRNDGSWNTYHHSLSDSVVEFYITSPQFTLNIE